MIGLEDHVEPTILGLERLTVSSAVGVAYSTTIDKIKNLSL